MILVTIHENIKLWQIISISKLWNNKVSYNNIIKTSELVSRRDLLDTLPLSLRRKRWLATLFLCEHTNIRVGFKESKAGDTLSL
jgi:hypothetical protein